jgi:hypothetical protein
MFGAATTTVGPLVVGMFGKITAAVGSVYVALGLLGLILAAIAAAIAGLMIGIEWVKENTRSGQLEKAKKMANAAADAADKAAEAYQDISNSISSLGDKYKALDDLKFSELSVDEKELILTYRKNQNKEKFFKLLEEAEK